MLRVQPGRVRLPDVSFFSWDHFPGRILPPGAILGLSPDLAVEVLSPSNTREEMLRKRREYFAGGTRLVWEVDPEERTVRVYTTARRSTLLREGDTLDGGAGHDHLVGGGNSDVLLARDHAKDVVDGGPGRDTGSVDKKLDATLSVEKLMK